MGGDGHVCLQHPIAVIMPYHHLFQERTIYPSHYMKGREDKREEAIEDLVVDGDEPRDISRN